MQTDDIEEARAFLEEAQTTFDRASAELQSARESYDLVLSSVTKHNSELAKKSRTDRFKSVQNHSKQNNQSKQQAVADARMLILGAIEHYKNQNGGGVRLVVESIAEKFPMKTIEGVPDWVYDIIAKCNKSTLWSWKKAYKEAGRDGLIPQYKGCTNSYVSCHPEQAILIDQILSKNSNITATNLRKKVAEKSAQKEVELPSSRTFQRIISNWHLKEH